MSVRVGMTMKGIAVVPTTIARAPGALAGSLGAMTVVTRPRIAPRNAPSSEPRYQAQLRGYTRALRDAYGDRKDFELPNHKRGGVPYVPAPYAAAMVKQFRGHARYWLDKWSVPVEARQPNFIKNHVRAAEDAASHVEDAPTFVASKAARGFVPEVAAGQPHPQVLTASATWDLLDQLQRLAVHFDGLSGQPSKLEIFADAVSETIEELPGRIERALEEGKEAPSKLLGTLVLVGAGLGVLYVVTR